MTGNGPHKPVVRASVGGVGITQVVPPPPFGICRWRFARLGLAIAGEGPRCAIDHAGRASGSTVSYCDFCCAISLVTLPCRRVRERSSRQRREARSRSY